MSSQLVEGGLMDTDYAVFISMLVDTDYAVFISMLV